MFTKKQESTQNLENALDSLFAQMHMHEADSNEYAQMADQVVKLYKLKEVDSSRRISPDVLLTVAGNLAGIVAIIGYERTHVIASKALGFVLKAR